MELESHFFENHSPSVLVTVDFVAKRIASSCTKKIQSKGLIAVKNYFADIVCEKFIEHINNNTVSYKLFTYYSFKIILILKYECFKVTTFNIDENDIAKCSVFLNSTIQQYVENFSKHNIPNSIKELLDDSMNPGSLPFCVAVGVRKFKALVTEWVKNHINIKSKIYIFFL